MRPVSCTLLLMTVLTLALPAEPEAVKLDIGQAKVTADVGRQGNNTRHSLPDPGDEVGWTLEAIEPGVYQIVLEGRTGDRGEGLSFIAGYRMTLPRRAFPAGREPTEQRFALLPGATPVVAQEGKGWKVFRAPMLAEGKYFLRPGDTVRVKFTGHYASLWSLELRPVPEAEQVDLHLSIERVGHLFRHGEPVPLQAMVTNWHAEPREWELVVEALDLGNQVARSATQSVAIPARTASAIPTELRLDRCGPFWARVSVREKGKTLLARETGFGITPAPRAKDLPDDSPFGIHKGDLTEWPAIGAKWNRLWDTGDTWNRYEKKRGEIQWEKLDEKVALAERHGVKLLYVFAYTPTWASSRPDESHYTGPGAKAPPRDPADWQNFIRAVVSRYKGRMDAFEIWNEPNAGFFSGNVDEYMELLKTGYAAAKQANPDCTVLGVSGTGGYLPWLRDICERGGLNFMDAVSVHTYTTPSSPEQANLLGRMAGTRAIIAKYGGQQPIWNTEVGIWQPERENGRPLSEERIAAKAPEETKPNWKAGWPFRPVSEQAAAENCVRTYVLALASGTARLFWYAWYTHSMPMLCDDGSPRLMSVAYGGMTARLNGARYLKRVDLGAADLHLHLFARGRDHLAVAWAAGREERTIAFDTRRERVMVGDLWGNDDARRVKDGRLTIKLSGAPVYLQGLSLPELEAVRLGGSRLVLQAVDADVTADVGTEAVKEHTSRPHHGDRRVVALADPGDEITWTLRGVAPGQYEVTLEARSGSRPPGVDVIKSYALRHQPAEPGSEGETVAFHLAPGAVPEETSQGKNYSLFYAPMRADKRLVLRSGDRLSLTSKSGYAFVSKLTLGRVGPAPPEGPAPCPRTARAPRIDGDLGDWSVALKLPINQRRQAVIGVADPFASTSERDSWRGPQDLSAEVRVAWTGKGLCLAVTVTDDRFVPPPETGGAYNGDAVEFFLDLRAPDQVGSAAMEDGVRQIFVNFDPRRPGSAHVRGSAPEGTHFAARRTKTGYTVEGFVPFSGFPKFAPKAGSVLGFDVAADDADNVDAPKPTRKSQLVWHGTANNFQDPSRYGRLVLR